MLALTCRKRQQIAAEKLDGSGIRRGNVSSVVVGRLNGRAARRNVFSLGMAYKPNRWDDAERQGDQAAPVIRTRLTPSIRQTMRLVKN